MDNRQVAKILEIGPYPPPYSGWAIRIQYVKNRIEDEGHVCEALNIGKNRKVPSDEYIPVQSGLDYVLKSIRYAAKGYTIHTHTNGDGPIGFCLSLVAALAGCAFGRRVVLSFHAGTHQVHFPRERSGWYFPVLYILFKLPKLILCDNEAVKQKIQEFNIPQAKIIPIQTFGVNYIQYSQALLPQKVEQYIEEHDPVIFTYFFLRNGYHLETLVEGMKRIRERWPNVGLINAGSIDDYESPVRESIMQMIANERLESSFCFAGDLSHDQFIALLGRAKLYLRTPTTDGECASVLEALTIGIPVVAAENGNRPAGVATYEADDPLDLCERVSEVLTDYESARSRIVVPPVSDTVGAESDVLIQSSLNCSVQEIADRRYHSNGTMAVPARILEVGPFPPPPNGWATRIAFVKQDLEDLGHECIALNIGENRKSPSSEYECVRSGFEYVAKLLRFSRRGYLSHVHANGDSIKGFAVNIVAYAVSLLHGRRPVLTFHAGTDQFYFPRSNSKAMVPVFKFLFSIPKAIICNNDKVKQLIVQYGVAPEKVIAITPISRQYVETVPSILDTPIEQFLQRHERIIVTYLEAREEYALPAQFRAFGNLTKTDCSVGVFVVGASKDGDAIHAIAEAECMSDHTFHLGAVDHDVFISIVKCADVYFRCNRREGTSSSIREALYLNVPVVANDTGSHPDKVVVYPWADAVAMEVKLREVLYGAQIDAQDDNRVELADTVRTESDLLIQCQLTAGDLRLNAFGSCPDTTFVRECENV